MATNRFDYRKCRYGWDVFETVSPGVEEPVGRVNVQGMARRMIAVLNEAAQQPDRRADKYEKAATGSVWEIVNTEDGEWEASFLEEKYADTFLFAMSLPDPAAECDTNFGL